MRSTVCAVLVCFVFVSLVGAQTVDQFFDSNGVRIRYIVTGQGEPVVLIHPFAASAEIWESVTKDLSHGFQVIAMDCRGHGRSDKPHDPKQYGIEMVNDVVRLMDHLKIKKAAIVGYSMGGSIAIKMLTEHADRFRVAVIGGSLGFTRWESEHDETPLLGPNLLKGMPLSEAMIASAPPDWPKPGPQQREMMRRMDGSQDPVALGAETVSHEGLWVDDEQLKAITVPTLIIYGGKDRPTFYERAEHLFPNLHFRSIEGAGHGPALQSPEFLRDVRGFIDQHKSAAQVPAPDAPAVRQFEAWLTAYNSGDRTLLLKFLQHEFPLHASDIDREMQRRLNLTGGYELKKVEKTSPAEISAVVKMRDLEQYARATLEVEPAEPHHISRLDVEMIQRPPEFPSIRMSQGDAIAALDSKLRSDAAADRFAGAVLVAKDGKPIFSGAYGLADRERTLPINSIRAFDWAR